jgi:hypothetical protein
MFTLRVIHANPNIPFGVVASFATALHSYVNTDVSRHWGVNMAIFASQDINPRPGEMRLYILDRPKTYAPLARHIWGENGDPEAVVHTGLCDDWRVPWTRIACHDAIEMVIDPWVNRYVWAGGFPWALEICDPVWEFGVPVESYEMANYVLPAYFRPGGVGPFDRAGKLTHPLEISPQGYLQRIENGVLRTMYGVSSPANLKGIQDGARKDRRLCS